MVNQTEITQSRSSSSVPDRAVSMASSAHERGSTDKRTLLAPALATGARLHMAGERGAAEKVYRQILEVDSQQPDALNLLGLLEYERRNFSSALTLMSQAIAVDPNRAAYYSGLGNVLRAMGNLRQAAEVYLKALRLSPENAETWVNLGNAYKDGEQFDDAVTCYRQAILLAPNLVGAHSNLANALRKLNRLDEARASYDKALEIDPKQSSTHYNIASLLYDLGDLNGALEHCQQSAELEKGAKNRIHFLEAQIRLLRGEFEAGWELFENRWNTPDHDTPQRKYVQSQWTGESLGHGELFIWGEQGVGDEVMFAGLIPDVSRITKACTLECDHRLLPLFKRSFPHIKCVSRSACGTNIDFAAHTPSGSLPRIVRSSHEAFGATTSPYLIADKTKRRELRDRYNDGMPLVGIAWKTNSKKTGNLRSIPLQMFAPLLSNDVKAINLQYGKHDELAAEAHSAAVPLLIDQDVNQLEDLDAFAAQIAAMDLVLTIDNSTAHFAGALGVPTWLLLPVAPDWRWQLERQDSAWYPSVRIFRQTQAGNWKPVLDQVGDALNEWKSLRASGQSQA